MDNNTLTSKTSLRMAQALFGLEPMPCLDTLQIELLLAAAGDSAKAFFDDIINTFRAECSPRIEAMAEACAAQDINVIKRHIHFIAGSSANIGLGRLSTLCRNIEKQCDDDAFTAFDTCVPIVQQEIQTAIDEIHALLAK